VNVNAEITIPQKIKDFTRKEWSLKSIVPIVIREQCIKKPGNLTGYIGQ
jgi:hypothetical protein